MIPQLLSQKKLHLFLMIFVVVIFETLFIGGLSYITANASTYGDTPSQIEKALLEPSAPQITISKLTNGPNGLEENPYILIGGSVAWSYTITNSGTEPLTGVSGVDDNGTPLDPSDDIIFCATFNDLQVNESQTCSYSIPGGAQSGAQTSTASISANAPGNIQVTATDSSGYFGASPGINIIKTTNGIDANSPPGPTILVGNPVNWNYFIQNTGNVSLTAVSVTDNRGVSVSCPAAVLGTGESMNCSASGVAQAGQYNNIGSVSAQPPVGPTITDTDPSNYFGQGSTSTATATRTSTATQTPVITGTPPTPTATGTITPNPILTVSVSPLQARVNQSLTFTVRVTNPGTAPAHNAVVFNSFPTFIDVINVTFDEGVVTKTIHSVSVDLDNLAPGANTTISILTRVNSSLTSSQTLSNIVSLTYNTNLVRTASVVYGVIASTTLPGTGDLPLAANLIKNSPLVANRFLWLGLVLGVIFCGWSLWKPKGKGLLPVLGLLVILTIMVVSACSTPEQTQHQVNLSPIPSETATQTLLPFMPAYRFSTPEVYPTMPNYPVPSPSLIPTNGINGPELDSSSVVRIVIPSLDVDAIVHYIPFEGLTWPIEGLREDVAWLGNSSWPGLGGNTVLAGHVTVKGIGNGPFRYLEDLKEGDEVIVYTENSIYTYATREQVTVEETDLGITLPTIHPQLTLITCTGWDNELSIYRFRRVVFADLRSTEDVIHQGLSR